MKLPFLSKINSISSSNSSDSSNSLWPWPPYCHQQPKTLSFRTQHSQMFKTVNTAYNIIDSAFDDTCNESWIFTNSSHSLSSSTESNESNNNDSVETMIRGLRLSEKDQRLFFKPGETSSIMEEAKTNYGHRRIFEESLVLSMDSDDPCVDFKKSMIEMLEAYNGLKDSWDGLEELLCWYLKMNSKSNHGYVISAFVDLLVNLTLTTTCCQDQDQDQAHQHQHQHQHQRSPSSPLSFNTISSSYSCDESCNSSCNCVSLLEIDEEAQEIHEITGC